MLEIEGAFTLLFPNIGKAARHVNGLGSRLPKKIERPDDPRARLFGAGNEGCEPTGSYEDIIIYENHILTLHLLETKVSGLVGRQVLVFTDQFEVMLLCPF